MKFAIATFLFIAFGNLHYSRVSALITLGDATAQCGNHQQISCCSKANSAGALLDGLLGGNCSPVDLSILAINVPISTACSFQVACCTGDQNGLLNLPCTNLNL